MATVLHLSLWNHTTQASFLSLPFPSFIQQMSGNHYSVQLWAEPWGPRDSNQVPDLEEVTEHGSGPPQVRLPQAGSLGDALYKRRPTSWEEKERSGAGIAVTEPPLRSAPCQVLSRPFVPSSLQCRRQACAVLVL